MLLCILMQLEILPLSAMLPVLCPVCVRLSVYPPVFVTSRTVGVLPKRLTPHNRLETFVFWSQGSW